MTQGSITRHLLRNGRVFRREYVTQTLYLLADLALEHAPPGRVGLAFD
jgi:hypothetical protein